MTLVTPIRSVVWHIRRDLEWQQGVVSAISWVTLQQLVSDLWSKNLKYIWDLTPILDSRIEALRSYNYRAIKVVSTQV